MAQTLKTPEYEKTIDRAEADSDLEKLKSIKEKFKDKAEDFVINEIFKVVRTTGYTYGIIIINELAKNIHTYCKCQALGCPQNKTITNIALLFQLVDAHNFVIIDLYWMRTKSKAAVFGHEIELSIKFSISISLACFHDNALITHKSHRKDKAITTIRIEY